MKKPPPEWLVRWRENPRRWDPGALMAIPLDERVFERGIIAKRTSVGISWGIYFREPIVEGSKKTRTKHEMLPNCRNKTQAEGVLVTKKGEIFQGTYQPKRRLSETTLREWLPEFVKLRAHRKTVKKYESQIKRRFLKKWGSLPLRALKRADVQAWYVHRLGEVETATANNELAALRTFFSEAVANDKCEVNPCRGIKTRAANNARDRVLSADEVGKLAKAAADIGEHMPALFSLLYFTGGRLSEILELRWASVDYVRATVRLHDAKDGRPRDVPIHEDLGKVLRAWQSKAKTEWVFPGRTKKAHRTKSRHHWALLCAGARVTVTAHELRHNFVSQLQIAGMSDTIIMDLTGHRTLTMLKRYSHSRDAHRAKAIAALPSLPAQSPGNHLRLMGVVNS